MNKVQKYVFIGFTMAITSFILLTFGNHAFGIEYKNYTSEKYGIQFEYPSNWELTEKTSRFDEGPDIQIKSGTNRFDIYRYNNAENDLGTLEVGTASDNVLNGLMSTYDLNAKIIEDPSYIFLDGYRAQTFLISVEKDGMKGGHQNWTVIVGNHAFQIINLELANEFDSLENSDIRNHFIDSLKFR
jgi:hypothetical protein